MTQLKQIEVVAAIMMEGGKVLATQRGCGEWKGWWEFPGGKIHSDEAPEEALRREIREELATEISVGELLTTVEYDYATFHLTMHCYLCQVIEGNITLLEHSNALWLTHKELDSLQWLPADEEVLPLLKSHLVEHNVGGTSFRSSYM